jgi:hypothetical protein
MRPPGWKWIAAMSVLVLGIVVSVSGAATSGSKRDGGSGTSTLSEKRQGEKRLHVIGPPGEHLSTLADELGVTEAKLRDAFEAVREDLKPPERPRRGQPPTKAEMEKRCNELTDALAKELGKSGDDVRAAMKTAAKKEIEEAVDAKRLTRSQADKILSQIDDAACAPKFGLHIRGGHGCGGPGGPDGPGERGRFEHPAPAPGSGSEGSSNVVPAPLGAPA